MLCVSECDRTILSNKLTSEADIGVTVHLDLKYVTLVGQKFKVVGRIKIFLYG